MSFNLNRWVCYLIAKFEQKLLFDKSDIYFLFFYLKYNNFCILSYKIACRREIIFARREQFKKCDNVSCVRIVIGFNN